MIEIKFFCEGCLAKCWLNGEHTAWPAEAAVPGSKPHLTNSHCAIKLQNLDISREEKPPIP